MPFEQASAHRRTESDSRDEPCLMSLRISVSIAGGTTPARRAAASAGCWRGITRGCRASATAEWNAVHVAPVNHIGDEPPIRVEQAEDVAGHRTELLFHGRLPPRAPARRPFDFGARSSPTAPRPSRPRSVGAWTWRPARGQLPPRCSGSRSRRRRVGREAKAALSIGSLSSFRAPWSSSHSRHLVSEHLFKYNRSTGSSTLFFNFF